MVQHKIRRQGVFLGQAVDILPIAKSGVHLVIGHDREAAVSGGRKKGEKMDPLNRLVKMFVQYGLQLFQIAAHAVCIRDQHHFIFDSFHLRHSNLLEILGLRPQPFTAPSVMPLTKDFWKNG